MSTKIKQQNDVLYARIKAGDATAVKDLILANLAGIPAVCRNFIRKQPPAAYLRYELECSGEEALVCAANKLVNHSVRSVSNYLYAAVKNALRSCYINAPVFGPKRAIVDRRHARQEPTGEMNCKSISFANCTSPKYRNGVPYLGKDERGDAADINALDLRDELDDACDTKNDRDFVNLRAEGYTDSEIAAQLKISPRTVGRTRRKLSALYCEAMALQRELTNDDICERLLMTPEQASRIPRISNLEKFFLNA